MENLRKKMRKQQKFLGLIVLLGLVFILMEERVIGLLHVTPTQVIIEFQMGLLLAITLLCILQVIKISKALSDDRKLQLYYNDIHDERKAAIRLRSGFPIVIITSSLMICGGFIASFYNEMIFFTLLIAALTQLVLCVCLKFYLMKKG